MSETLTARSFTRAAIPGRDEPDWARTLRGESFEAFATLPVPSQETEEWRYTDMSGFDLESFVPFAPGTQAANLDEIDDRILEAAGEVGDRAGFLIQHNSQTATVHLASGLAEQGVIFSSIDRAIAEQPDLLRGRLHAGVPSDRTKFTAQHAAFRSGGVFLYVPAGVAVELPFQALTYVDADASAVFPHTVLVAEEDSEVTLIDRFVSPDLEGAFSNAVAELYLGPAARVRYLSLQDWGRGVTHLAVQRAVLERDAQIRSLSVAFGGALSRTEVEAVLAGPGGHSEMLGLYFADGTQHYDHRSLQDHMAPQCTSQLLYKGALKETSRAVYSGLIRINKGAWKSDAMQTNRNIVLSDGARADSIPNLEIDNNDVRCGHAASVGPVDENELFYLQTRGIPLDEAERLIVKGFFQEVLDRVPLEEVRLSMEAAIETELRS